MQIFATAGAEEAGKTAVVAALTGKRAENPHAARLRATVADLGEGEHLTIFDVPAGQTAKSEALTGWLLADGILFVLNPRQGWNQESAKQLELFRCLGIPTVIAVVADGSAPTATLQAVATNYLQTANIPDYAVMAIDLTPGNQQSLNPLRAAIKDSVVRMKSKRFAQPARVWIERAFKKPQTGTVAVGVVIGDAVRINEPLMNLTNARSAVLSAIQWQNQRVTEAAAGSFVALSLPELDPISLPAGTLLTNDSALPTSSSVETAMNVLTTSPQPLRHSEVYVAHVGSWQGFVECTMLGRHMLAPGESGPTQLRFARPLTVLQNDRIVLRSVTGDIVSAGRIVEIANTVDHVNLTDADSLLRARGWMDVEEWERVTGGRRAATIGRWVVDLGALEEMGNRLRLLLSNAGSAGVDISSLSEKELAVLQALSGVEIRGDRVFTTGVEPDFTVRPLRNVAALEI